ncbi:DUF6285 domain-containing protein [Mycolicibacterium goodii]|uniref:DUF6285 domain-containing protein n=1 Tax=Mycolicibacterium goodii TaxID=134601 RepID=A0A0K0XCW7_MYCGD|nr:hypothetical protein AFA91_28735 [Mycolicibacterium goodii]
MTGGHGRPTAAELVAAVAEFLDTEVRAATAPGGANAGAVNFHARVAANALRMVERELLAAEPVDALSAMNRLGFDDEAAFAAAIRAGDLDGRPDEVTACLRALVKSRLDVAHPGYDAP